MLHLRNCNNCLFNHCNRSIIDGYIRSKKITVSNYYHCIKPRKNGFVCKYYSEVPTYEKNNKI